MDSYLNNVKATRADFIEGEKLVRVDSIKYYYDGILGKSDQEEILAFVAEKCPEINYGEHSYNKFIHLFGNGDNAYAARKFMYILSLLSDDAGKPIFTLETNEFEKTIIKMTSFVEYK